MSEMKHLQRKFRRIGMRLILYIFAGICMSESQVFRSTSPSYSEDAAENETIASNLLNLFSNE
jgi:hypothetical protein